MVMFKVGKDMPSVNKLLLQQHLSLVPVKRYAVSGTDRKSV